MGSVKYATALPGSDNAERHQRELAEALKAVPWAPAGLAATDDSPEGRASALLAWADGHRGVEADAIIASLRPLLLKHLDEDLASGMPRIQGFAAGPGRST